MSPHGKERFTNCKHSLNASRSRKMLKNEILKKVIRNVTVSSTYINENLTDHSNKISYIYHKRHSEHRENK